MTSRTRNGEWTVVDLFSGAGGMSFGFNAHPRFRVVAAADAENAKPSSGAGTLECNKTYYENIGLAPLRTDLAKTTPSRLRKAFPDALSTENPTVLISCAPCTGFSRVLRSNHLRDDRRNSLVGRSLLFVKDFRPEIFLMENARELIRGNFSHHFDKLVRGLSRLGYNVHGSIHFLDRFGLPQRRERALVTAVRDDLELHTLGELWMGKRVCEKSTHVRHVIGHLPSVAAGKTHSEDALHVSPNLTDTTYRRLKLLPPDGGSWADLRDHPERDEILIPSMLRYLAQGKLGSHPDVYGRMWWDRPAVTIKRECGHVGNGRYSHPEQIRLCTVREMSLLQGFPRDFRFAATSIGNMYRHIGDAVPPLISYQLARVCEWILTGRRPSIKNCILKNTHLANSDIESVPYQKELVGCS